jgi:hypothetical protein
MPIVYKIHPAIGIMRLGDSEDAFFVGPEAPGETGVELDANGAETPVTARKAAGRIKRQAARFRVWEYEAAADGTVVPVREVTDYATVRWTVHLVNSKAAGPELLGQADGSRSVLVPGGPLRNASITGADRAKLVIDGGERSIAKGEAPQRFDAGRFLERPVPLGELRTDGSGRLLVLGGHGTSAGIPTAAGGPIPKLNSFANNNRWHDDVSDGPVTATVTLPGEAPVAAQPAWVICAPPDFAPAVGGVVSLYEIAIQAAIERGWMSLPNMPSFRKHVHTTLERSLNLRWAHTWHHWSAISDDWAQLSSTTNHDLRSAAYKALTQSALLEFGLPKYLAGVLLKWRDGQFVDDWATAPPPPSGPEALDRAALEACIGANFFPGIEAGFGITNAALYMEPFRLSPALVQPGQMTAAMALPWQADFNDCSDNWWPSQRPNNVYSNAAQVPDDPVSWAQGVYTGNTSASRSKMVERFGKLGFLVDDGTGRLLETERDPSLGPH